MTDEEVLTKYAQLEEMFGKLPDPIREPISFAYLVKLMYYRTAKQQALEKVDNE